MPWGRGFDQRLEHDNGVGTVFGVVRGLMAWTLAQEVGIPPEQADEYIGRHVTSAAHITPAGVAAILQSAYEDAIKDTGS